MDTLTFTRPDDWHLHLRDGPAMADVLAHSAARFGRALIMPNLCSPVATTEQALAYRQRILNALPEEAHFQPWMTLYLTSQTTPAEIAQARASNAVLGIKLYPAGATTHSEAGVTDLAALGPVLDVMAEHDLPLLVHGEVTDPAVDIFDREAVFIERHLAPLVERHPRLRIVLEHVSTREGVEFVRGSGPRVAGTITVHHLLYDRNALFTGGLRPHMYCLPVLKREHHRQALIEAATGGESVFFFGSDSAPHARAAKERACGCAGIYTAHAAIELLAELFDATGALDRLPGFASHQGADFYGLPRNGREIGLVREPWPVPDAYRFGDETLIPLRAGETIAWRLVTK